MQEVADTGGAAAARAGRDLSPGGGPLHHAREGARLRRLHREVSSELCFCVLVLVCSLSTSLIVSLCQVCGQARLPLYLHGGQLGAGRLRDLLQGRQVQLRVLALPRAAGVARGEQPGGLGLVQSCSRDHNTYL